MRKARPAPIDDGFKLVTENEKKVEKLAGDGEPSRRNLTGTEYRTRPAPDVGTARSRVRRTLPLFQWASPRSFRLVSVSVPKSNSVAPLAVRTMPQQSRSSRANLRARSRIRRTPDISHASVRTHQRIRQRGRDPNGIVEKKTEEIEITGSPRERERERERTACRERGGKDCILFFAFERQQRNFIVQGTNRKMCCCIMIPLI